MIFGCHKIKQYHVMCSWSIITAALSVTIHNLYSYMINTHLRKSTKELLIIVTTHNCFESYFRLAKFIAGFSPFQETE